MNNFDGGFGSLMCVDIEKFLGKNANKSQSSIQRLLSGSETKMIMGKKN